MSVLQQFTNRHETDLMCNSLVALTVLTDSSLNFLRGFELKKKIRYPLNAVNLDI